MEINYLMTISKMLQVYFSLTPFPIHTNKHWAHDLSNTERPIIPYEKMPPYSDSCSEITSILLFYSLTKHVIWQPSPK